MSAINTKTKNGYAIFSFGKPEDEWRCKAPPLIFWFFGLTKLAAAIFSAHVKKNVGLGNIVISYKTEQPHTQTVAKNIET